MGVNLKELLIRKPIKLEELRGKTLAVDAHNTLYQFLTTIRSPDGSVFTDAHGRTTSHLIGLFNRTTKLMEQGLKLVFVFDGKPPALKKEETARRRELKEEALRLYEDAKKAGETDEMHKYAARTSYLTPEMIEESKTLLRALGLPVIQAPSEGEAQAAYLVKKHQAFACVSQDYDNMVFGCPRTVRNLSVEGKKKVPGKMQFVSVEPEMIELKENLENLGIDQDQLILLALLVGTDYNYGGVHKIGPKTALKLVKEIKEPEILFKKVGWEKHCQTDWRELIKLFKEMPVTDDYELNWHLVNEKELKQLLIEKHNFSAERTEKKIKDFLVKQEEKTQSGLNKWF